MPRTQIDLHPAGVVYVPDPDPNVCTDLAANPNAPVIAGRVSVGVPAAAGATRVAVPEELPGNLAPVTPSVVRPVTPRVELAVSVVNNPAAAVVVPIVVASMVPPLVSTDASVATPEMDAVVPTNNAFATPMPPAVMIDPVVVLVESVTRLLLMPAANGMRWVVTVWPSFVIEVDRPVPKSAVSALKSVDEMTVPVTTGWPALFMLKVPEPL